MTERKTTDNGQFGTMAGVAPQKRQCDFGGFAPDTANLLL